MNRWLLLELFLDFGLPALMALAGGWLIWRAWPHTKKNAAPICPACKYNLTGSSSATCPECGAALSDNWRGNFKYLGKKKAALGLLLLIPMCWVLWMCVSYYSWAAPRHWRVTQLQKVQPTGAKFEFQRQISGFSWRETMPSFRESPALWVACTVSLAWSKSYPSITSGRYIYSPVELTLYMMDEPGFSLQYIQNTPAGVHHLFIHLCRALTRPNTHYKRYFHVSNLPAHSVKVSHVTAKDQQAMTYLADAGEVGYLEITNSTLDGPLIKSICKVDISTGLLLDRVTAAPDAMAGLSGLNRLQTLAIAFDRPIQPADLDAIAKLPSAKWVMIVSRTGPLGSECDAALSRLIRKPGLEQLRIPVILAPHPQTTGALGDSRVTENVVISETGSADDLSSAFDLGKSQW